MKQYVYNFNYWFLISLLDGISTFLVVKVILVEEYAVIFII